MSEGGGISQAVWNRACSGGTWTFGEICVAEDPTFLKPLTKLKKEAEKAKPTMTVQEKMVYLQAASLTPGGIFDEFNYFYFGYVSADWLEVLFELYGEFEHWPQQTKRKIARSLSLCRENDIPCGGTRCTSEACRARKRAEESVRSSLMPCMNALRQRRKAVSERTRRGGLFPGFHTRKT